MSYYVHTIPRVRSGWRWLWLLARLALVAMIAHMGVEMARYGVDVISVVALVILVVINAPVYAVMRFQYWGVVWLEDGMGIKLRRPPISAWLLLALYYGIVVWLWSLS